MNVWVFDVDGVITNIKQEKITEPLILDSIIKILEREELVAFNTGRGIDWTYETVLKQLADKTANQKILKNLFVTMEGGGVKATFNQDESLDVDVDESFKMPSELDDDVKKLLREKYFKTMRYEDKKTMITTKIKEGTSLNNYHRDQKEIIKDFQRLIDFYRLNNKLKVDASTIGTNIMYKNTGKDKGIELILEWLKKKKIKPQKFITFGDSFESDIPMAEKLCSLGFNVDFVYVGSESIDVSKYPFPIKQTQSHFGNGTLEFLKSGVA